METCDMDDSLDAKVKRDALHFMLEAALIEIRASASLNAAKKFADVFHNLPIALLKCSTSDEYDAQLLNLLERAKRSGIDSYVQKLHSVAMQAVTRGHIEPKMP
jgi:hypothetical protein